MGFEKQKDRAGRTHNQDGENSRYDSRRAVPEASVVSGTFGQQWEMGRSLQWTFPSGNIKTTRFVSWLRHNYALGSRLLYFQCGQIKTIENFGPRLWCALFKEGF